MRPARRPKGIHAPPYGRWSPPWGFLRGRASHPEPEVHMQGPDPDGSEPAFRTHSPPPAVRGRDQRKPYRDAPTAIDGPFFSIHPPTTKLYALSLYDAPP